MTKNITDLISISFVIFYLKPSDLITTLTYVLMDNFCPCFINFIKFFLLIYRPRKDFKEERWTQSEFCGRVQVCGKFCFSENILKYDLTLSIFFCVLFIKIFNRYCTLPVWKSGERIIFLTSKNSVLPLSFHDFKKLFLAICTFMNQFW